MNSEHCASLVQIQALCENLEYLHLSWYRVGKSCIPASETVSGTLQWRSRHQYMHELALSADFRKLRKLRLGGLSVHIADLVAFLRKHAGSLRELDLINIEVSDDSFKVLSAFFASESHRLLKYRLEDLQEAYHILIYDPSQESASTHLSGDLEGPFQGFRIANELRGLTIIERFGEDVRGNVEYVLHRWTEANGWSRRADELGAAKAVAATRTRGVARPRFRPGFDWHE